MENGVSGSLNCSAVRSQKMERFTDILQAVNGDSVDQAS